LRPEASSPSPISSSARFWCEPKDRASKRDQIL
jgi:hypothetical protein